MAIDTVYKSITRGVAVQDEHIIKERLQNGLPLKGFWAGVETTVYYADTYAFLVNHDVSIERVAYRTKYYQFLITAILNSLGVPKSKISFVTESESFTYNPEFIKKEHQLSVLASQAGIKACGNEIDETPCFSPMLCPGRQALAEAFLGVHFQLGGEDQRGMFNFGNSVLPRLGFEQKAHLVNPLLPALSGSKMSSSKAASTKIEFLDSADDVTQKIMGCVYDESQLEGSGLLAMVQMVIIPFTRVSASLGIKRGFSCLLVNGEKKTYRLYDDFFSDCKKGRVSGDGIKAGVAEMINHILEPIRQSYASNKEWQDVTDLAYPC
ncbi:Tyr-tRNA synthetase [Penicillium citrinum]|uniref:tyrosine--tRNA ligase n=1 Tax=Penicillium citrinum TaxID=5077 RepID=A0A9W9NRG9_PENCI|nr:Tyr-tRNA synthetase [Penicillium citrinum]KAJ5224806.1 Tyr-tRNA synthetase [Penicillium citrinum]